MRQLAADRATMFPAGVAAANLLGFTTQVAGRSEVATTAGSLPRKLAGKDTVIHTRRPEAWRRLPSHDAAFLELLARWRTDKRTLRKGNDPPNIAAAERAGSVRAPGPRRFDGAAARSRAVGRNRREDRHEHYDVATTARLAQPAFAVRFWRAGGTVVCASMAGQGARAAHEVSEHPDFRQAIVQAAEYFADRGLRPALIEKDYYVTETLRIIAATVRLCIIRRL